MQRLTPLTPVLAVAMFASVCVAAPQFGKSTGPQKAKDPAKQAQPTPPAAADPKGAQEANAPGEAKFYEKLDAADREALQVNVGYLMPAPSGTIDWIGGDALMAADFRDKVTVIQSVGGKSGGRTQIEKLKKLLPPEVQIIGLHIPDNADKAQATFGQNTPCLIAVDHSGDWCDALGVWKRPVNIVVDKTGAVRFVGLSDQGLKTKIEPLLAEVVDDSVVARPRPAAAKPVEATTKPTEWPQFTQAVSGATDMRGKTLPQFIVQKWVTRQPDPAGRLIAIDFWATWCPPCRAAIPHVNELQTKYSADVLFVGVSDEAPRDFEQGLQKYKLRPESFQYSLALDPAKRMSKFFAIGGIPHMAIMSPDMIVRWQGHPAQLQDADVQKLVDANKALSKLPAGKPGAGERGWVKGTSSPSR